jgi:carboxylesterase type B
MLMMPVAMMAQWTSSPVVDTTGGPVRGALGSGGVAVFRGIPYGQEPIGELRWRPPLPRKPWTSVLDATADGAGCPQICELPARACPPTLSDDCLHLNVFSPGGRSGPGLKKVMFWIHGGDYIQGYGGGPLYDGTSLARDHDVVVVATNYRLGALGFLRTGDDDDKGEFAGNFGLLDQRLALEWTRANIAKFGGDPDAVTIFGQSAGGMSVASHLSMPNSSHLFHRAIIESDPLALPFRTAHEYPKFSRVVGRKAKCGAPIEACLRSLTWQAVVEAQHEAKKDLLIEFGHFFDLFTPYSPAVGTKELPLQPLEAIERGTFQDKPVILGTVRDEGLLFGYQAFPTAESRTVEDGVLEAGFGLLNGPRILKQYPRSAAGKQARDMRNHTGVIATDGLFHCAARHGALTLASHTASGKRASSTWHYHFDHVPNKPLAARIWLPGFDECLESVCHSSELPFLWRANTSLAFINASFTPSEAAMAETLQSLWANFAKTGSPSGTPSGESAASSSSSSSSSDATASLLGAGSLPAWPPFSAVDEPMMRFTADPPSGVDHKAWRDKCAFWDTLGYSWGTQ